MPSILGSLVKSFSSDLGTDHSKASEANVEVCLSPSVSGGKGDVASKSGFDDNDQLQVEISESIPEVIDENAEDVVKQDSSLSSEGIDNNNPSSNSNQEGETSAVTQEVKKQEEEEKKDDKDVGEGDVADKHTPAKRPQEEANDGTPDTRTTSQLDDEEEKRHLHGFDDADDPNDATIIEFTNLAMAVANAEESKGSSSGTSSKGRRRARVPGGGSTLGDDGSVSNGSTVSFGSVQVREYERVIDSTNIYMGLALGWDYNQKPATPIKDRNRTGRYLSPMSTAPNVEPLDSKSEGRALVKRTNGSDRYRMYCQYGYTRKDLKKATNEAAKFYKQRQKEANREAARALVVADERTKGTDQKDKNRSPRNTGMMFRSMFHR